MFQTRDFDHTDRVPSATDPLIAADAPVKLLDVEFDFPFENDETSHELLLTSNYDGPFNFVAGAFSYENRTLFGVGVYGVGQQPPYTDTDPDVAAQAIGFGSCEEVLPAFGLNSDTTERGAFFLSQARNRSHWEHIPRFPQVFHLPYRSHAGHLRVFRQCRV